MLRALDDVALQAPFLGCMPTCLQSCVVNVSLIQVAQSALINQLKFSFQHLHIFLAVFFFTTNFTAFDMVNLHLSTIKGHNNKTISTWT